MLSRRALLAAALAPPAPKFFFTARGSEGVRRQPKGARCRAERQCARGIGAHAGRNG